MNFTYLFLVLLAMTLWFIYTSFTISTYYPIKVKNETIGGNQQWYQTPLKHDKFTFKPSIKFEVPFYHLARRVHSTKEKITI